MSRPTFQVPGPTSAAAAAIRDFCLEMAAAPTESPAAIRAALPTSAFWQRFRDVGTELWLDTGDVDAIEPRWCKQFTALTTNNTLLNKEVQKGIYDQLVPRAAEAVREVLPGASEHQVVLEIAFILNAVHGLKLVRSFDADVSVELHTDISTDIDASVRYGQRFAAIEPERFIVKVPLTPEGLIAARELREDGIRINFTLGFSARQNVLIAKVAKVDWVNVFMGRINSFISGAGLGSGDGAGEKATLASQRALRAIAAAGGPTVRQIGASIRSGQQVLDLAGMDVMTIPLAAADAANASGTPLEQIIDHTDDDPTVEATGCDAFWADDKGVAAAADELTARPTDELDGQAVLDCLQKHGAGDLFPILDDAEQKQIRADGKIPKFNVWKDRVAAKTANWDGLLSLAALESFAVDQQGLDDRIRGLI